MSKLPVPGHGATNGIFTQPIWQPPCPPNHELIGSECGWVGRGVTKWVAWRVADFHPHHSCLLQLSDINYKTEATLYSKFMRDAELCSCLYPWCPLHHLCPQARLLVTKDLIHTDLCSPSRIRFPVGKRNSKRRRQRYLLATVFQEHEVGRLRDLLTRLARYSWKLNITNSNGYHRFSRISVLVRHERGEVCSRARVNRGQLD